MDAAKTPAGNVTLTFSYEEAVVLSDLLWRWERDGTQDGLAFEDQAEQRVVSDLTAVFEPLIDEVFDKDGYANVVAHSRSKVRGALSPPPVVGTLSEIGRSSLSPVSRITCLCSQIVSRCKLAGCHRDARLHGDRPEQHLARR